jgi:hypothetical protein
MLSCECISIIHYFSNFALKCAIRVSQDNHLSLQLNVKHQLLALC